MTISEMIFDASHDDPSRDRVNDAVETMGLEMTDYAFDRAVSRTRRAADVSGDVSDTQVHAIVDDAISGAQVLQGVAESFR